MDDSKIIYLIETVGIKNLTHTQLINAYKFCTKKVMKDNCAECAKRRAIRDVLRYYNELKVN